MEATKYLDKIKRTVTLNELIQEIKNTFLNYMDESYMPAIINEGNFSGDDGEDFYLKLVLKHQAVPMKKTWLKENLSLGVEEPTDGGITDYGAYIHNVVTLRKYKSNSLYQLNPLLVSEEINEYENENSIHVNAYFNDEYSNIKGLPVLKPIHGDSILILRKVFRNYIHSPESNIYPKYELVAEFEYRTHHNHFNGVDNGAYETEDAFLRVSISDNSLVIVGSVVIEYLDMCFEKKQRNITVIDLGTFKPREHLADHYDGDITEGLVCFKYETMELLQKYYFFYDLQMFDKNDIQNKYLVDVLEDKIVFWEGEYNKLPNSVKDEIDPYNFIPVSPKGIISEAMAAMQLEVDWNWDKKLPPEYLLANLIREASFSRAIDIGLTFIVPKNVDQLREFIFKIEKLTNISLDRFNTSSKDVQRLSAIRDDKSTEKVPSDIKFLYQKYCYAIQMELSNELRK